MVDGRHPAHRPDARGSPRCSSCALLFGAGVGAHARRVRPHPAPAGRLLDATEGRLSVDAVIVVVCARPAVRPRASIRSATVGGHGADGQPPPTSPSPSSSSSTIVPVAVSACSRARSGPGVLRPLRPDRGDRRARSALARPNSPWARRRYREASRRSWPGRSAARTRLNAHWRAWRDAFFDLIAGKPHLPSLPPRRRAGGADRRRSPTARDGGQPAAATGAGEDAASGAGGRDDREVVEEPALRRHDGLARRRQVEPGGAVHLRELRLPARTRRPLHRERVARDGRRRRSRAPRPRRRSACAGAP